MKRRVLASPLRPAPGLVYGFVMVPFLACMALVASVYHLPPRVLPSIQAVEGGWAGAVIRNGDGSDDLGVMQVNTQWLAVLARRAGCRRRRCGGGWWRNPASTSRRPG